MGEATRPFCGRRGSRTNKKHERHLYMLSKLWRIKAVHIERPTASDKVNNTIHGPFGFGWR